MALSTRTLHDDRKCYGFLGRTLSVSELISETQDVVSPAAVPVARPVGAVLPHPPGAATSPLTMTVSRGSATVDLAFVFATVIGVMLGKDFFFENWSDEELRARTPLIITAIGIFSAIVVLGYVGFRKQSWSTLGLAADRPFVDAGIGVLAAGFIMLLMVAGSAFVWVFAPELIPALQESQRGIREILPPMNLPTIIGLTAVVAFYEELLFRGFLLTRLRVVTRRWWSAVTIGVLSFAALHFYQGPLAVLAIVLLSGVLSAVFIWRRSLIAPVTAHFVFNVTQLLMLQLAPKGPV